MLKYIVGYGVCTSSSQYRYNKQKLEHALDYIKDRVIYDPEVLTSFERVGKFKDLIKELLADYDDTNTYALDRIAAILIREYLQNRFPDHQIDVYSVGEKDHYVLFMPAKVWNMSEHSRMMSAEDFDKGFEEAFEDMLNQDVWTTPDEFQICAEWVHTSKELVRAVKYVRHHASKKDDKVS